MRSCSSITPMDCLSSIDALTGELILTQLFVAVWGASNYTYAEATLPDAPRLDRLPPAPLSTLAVSRGCWCRTI